MWPLQQKAPHFLLAFALILGLSSLTLVDIKLFFQI